MKPLRPRLALLGLIVLLAAALSACNLAGGDHDYWELAVGLGLFDTAALPPEPHTAMPLGLWAEMLCDLFGDSAVRSALWPVLDDELCVADTHDGLGRARAAGWLTALGNPCGEEMLAWSDLQRSLDLASSHGSRRLGSALLVSAVARSASAMRPQPSAREAVAALLSRLRLTELPADADRPDSTVLEYLERIERVMNSPGDRSALDSLLALTRGRARSHIEANLAVIQESGKSVRDRTLIVGAQIETYAIAGRLAAVEVSRTLVTITGGLATAIEHTDRFELCWSGGRWLIYR